VVRIEQLIEYTVFTEAGALAATVVRNFLAKGFIKKGLNSKLVEHINEFIENVHLYTGVSVSIVSTVN